MVFCCWNQSTICLDSLKGPYFLPINFQIAGLQPADQALLQFPSGLQTTDYCARKKYEHLGAIRFTAHVQATWTTQVQRVLCFSDVSHLLHSMRTCITAQEYTVTLCIPHHVTCLEINSETLVALACFVKKVLEVQNRLEKQVIFFHLCLPKQLP